MVIAVAAPVRAQEAELIAKAEAASRAWLDLTDAGAYSDSWDRAAVVFQASVPKTTWIGSIQAVRPPLGRLEARALNSAKFARSLPGAPDGEYVVIEYATRFEHKPGAIETVTPMREADGSWRVSGYYIK